MKRINISEKVGIISRIIELKIAMIKDFNGNEARDNIVTAQVIVQRIQETCKQPVQDQYRQNCDN